MLTALNDVKVNKKKRGEDFVLKVIKGSFYPFSQIAPKKEL